MQDLLKELLNVVLPSCGILFLREIIALIYKYFKIPKELRLNNKIKRQHKKINKTAEKNGYKANIHLELKEEVKK